MKEISLGKPSILSFKRQSLTSNLNHQNISSDSKCKPECFLQSESDFGNRVENLYKPADRNKIDANNKILHAKSILNKITLQTFEKLKNQLEALEIDRYERLEGRISILFSKVILLQIMFFLL